MWIFLNDAFYSIVQDKDDSSRMMVRARLPGDLERYFPDHKVLELDDADYRFRVFAAREEVADLVFHAVHAIDYPDFKSSINREEWIRKGSYSRVWADMQAAQRQAKIVDEPFAL